MANNSNINYSDWSREELIAEVKKLKKRKKYGLIWEEKSEDLVEQCKKELPVLEEDQTKEIAKDSRKSTNIIIEGDNYHSLSVLNYTHKEKIDFIYIDPPYNTGAKDWKYNNNFVDSTDSFRHSKWLSFMSHRLKLAYEVLKKDGVICITVDDYEMPRLWLLMEKIFQERNHLGTVAIRNNPKGRMTNKDISLVHEYAIFFGKTEKSTIKRIPINPKDKTHSYKQEKDGTWYLPVNLRKQGVDSNSVNKKGKISDRYYPIYYDPTTKKVSTSEKLEIEIFPIDQSGQKRIWRRAKEAINEMYENGDLWVQETRHGLQPYYKFRGGLEGQMPQSIWYDAKFSASDYGTKILDKIMGKREMFQYPKSPYAVIQAILSGTNSKKAVILDFFAGSGTTGQAVLMLNQEDGGNRQFILCTNNEGRIAEEICYPRVKKVIEGYSDIKGIPANLRYFKTTFVSKSRVSDDTRRELIKRSAEMICIRENTFEKVVDKKGFKIYKDANHTTGILFDLDMIGEMKNKLKDQKLSTHVYVFSLTNDTFNDDFEDLNLPYKLCPIPESILEVYKKLF